MGEQRVGAQDWPSLATAEDIIQVYRLFQRREPESQALADDVPARSLADMVRTTLLSDEFRHANIGPLETGHVPGSSLDAPSSETIQWALTRLSLTRASQRKLKRAVNFLQAYHALLSDAGLRSLFGQDDPLFVPSLLAKMDKASRLQGMIDIPHGRTLTGWARNPDKPEVPMQVEIWINGRFIGVAATGRYRHDTAARFASEGCEGFWVDLPATISGKARIQVRDAPTRLFLADFEADFDPIGPETVDILRSELAQIRNALTEMEKRLPERMRASAHSLDQYGAYYEIWLRSAILAETPDQDAAVLVVLDAADVPNAQLEDSVWSLVAQRHEDFCLIVGLRQKDLAFLHDLMARVRWRRDMRIDYVIVDDAPAWRSGIEVTPNVVVVQCMRADGVLHPDALRCMAEPFVSKLDLAAVYCDEDGFVEADLADWSRRAHDGPILKPAFDYDLLLQTPYVGSFIAFSRMAWLDMLTRDAGPADLGESRLEPARQTLQLSLAGVEITHLAQILFTRASPHEPDEGLSWRTVVAGHLGQRASVEPHDDILGAEVIGASRVRWSLPADAGAAIIIPTRNRVDLLQPCVDSILATLSANKTQVRLHLIDHESTEPETAAYLSSLASRDGVQVQPFSGPFNWALMNNLAAHALTEDVLIFLNNDTLVISPEWIDELTAQAMREDVGVVGCRLIYADGAIQHAGFLALDSCDRFLTHDGAGDAGSSAGYLGRNALTHRTVAVTGACMAVRRDVFRQLGGFDAARFPVDSNDVDFCFKAIQAGLKVLYSPFPTLYHLESRSRPLGSAAEKRMSADAQAQRWARWGSKICPDPWYNPRFSREAEHFSRLIPK